MVKLEKLNKKQVALMDEVQDEWVDIALHKGPEIDKEECEAGVKWMYYASNLKEPKVVFVKGPKDFAKKVWSKVGSEVGSKVSSKVGSKVSSKVGSKFWSKVRSEAWSEVRSEAWSEVRSKVRSKVWSEVRSKVRSKVWSAMSGLDLSFDSDWASWYSYFNRIGIINNDSANKYIGYLKSGAFLIAFFEKVAFVMERPIAVYKDEQGRLHSTEHPAISFRDKTEMYSINGVSFDKKLWAKVVGNKLSAKDVFAIENTEQRRIAYELMDKLKMKKLKNYTVLDHRDKDEQGKMDEVVSFEVNGFDKPFLYYHCECPSTGRRYFIQTGSKTCVEAKNKSFGVDEIEWIKEW